MTTDVKTCMLCGGKIRASNTTGYCTKVAACRRENRKEIKRRNPEPAEVTRSRAARYYADNPDLVKNKVRTWQLNHPKHTAVQRAKARARKKGLPFDLTVDALPPIPEVCPALGIPLKTTPGKQGGGPGSPSLDRIKPELGYVIGNVIWISNKANMIKTSATVDEIFLVAEFYRRLEDA